MTDTEHRSKKNELLHHFANIVKSLELLRNIFISLATVEAKGQLPIGFFPYGEDIPEEIEKSFGTLYISTGGPDGSLTFDSYKCCFTPDNGETLYWKDDGFEPAGVNTYASFLFRSWSYEDGHSIEIETDAKSIARWHFDESSEGLEELSTRVEKSLSPIIYLNSYKELVKRTIIAIRNGKPTWKPGYVSWSYIKSLDEVIKDFELEIQMPDKTEPTDIIPLAVVVQNYQISRAQIKRDIADGKLISYRKKSSGNHLVSKKDVGDLYTKK